MNMLLSVSISRLVWRFGMDKTFELLSNAGFDAFDIYFSKSKGVPFPEEADLFSTASKLQELMQKTGVVCAQTHANCRIRENDEYSLGNPHFAEVVSTIKATAIVGAKYVVVHPFRHEDGSDEVEHLIEFYRALLPYAKKYGIKIATENLFRAAQNPEKMNRLLHGVDDESFVLCFDTGHASVVGIPPERFLSEIDPRYLAALHLHDNDGRRDLHQLPYLGTMDWKAILSTLAKCGYKGDMNMEIPLYFDHLPDSAMPDALSLAEKVGRDMINQFMMNRF